MPATDGELSTSTGRSLLAESLQHMPAGVVLAAAPSGRILFANEEARRLWGRPVDEDLPGWIFRHQDLVHADGQPYERADLPLTRVLRGEAMVVEEARIRRADGKWLDVLIRTSPLHDEGGHLVAAVATFFDISARKHLERQVRRAREDLQGLVDAIDGIVWEAEVPSYRVTFVSRQAERLLGYPVESWYRPRFWQDILHPEDREWAMQFRATHVERREHHDFEYRVLARDGRVVWLRDMVSVVVRDGRPVSVRGVMVDVTGRRQAADEREELLSSERQARLRAQQEHQRSAFLADVSHALASSLDVEQTLGTAALLAVPFLGDWALCATPEPNGTFRTAPAAASPSLAGVADALGRWHPRADSAGLLARVYLTGHAELHARVTPTLLGDDPAGVLASLPESSCLAVPLRARGRVLGVLLVAASVPERELDAADLLVAEDLASRAGLALDNAQLYRASQAAIGVREEFLSIASHELNTPLTSLRFAVQALQKGVFGNPSPAAASALKLVDRQADRLTRLVGALLDVSHLQTQPFELHREQVDLASLAAEVIELLREDIGAAGSAVLLDAPVPVIGSWDRVRIEQVVTNLLANALKFGAGKPIEVRVGREKNAAKLVVRDHGIGIPADRVDRIFRRFERGVSAREYGGLGLGLFVVRTYVEQMGGTVDVESRAGEGATFTVMLPILEH